MFSTISHLDKWLYVVVIKLTNLRCVEIRSFLTMICRNPKFEHTKSCIRFNTVICTLPYRQYVFDHIALIYSNSTGHVAWLPLQRLSSWCLVIQSSQGLYSLSRRTSYGKISWILEAAKLGVIMVASLWHLTGISAVLLPRSLSNFRAIGNG